MVPTTASSYALEFRRQMVDLVPSGRTPEELSREFEPTAQTIWNWVRRADRDEGR
jgi:transposase